MKMRALFVIVSLFAMLIAGVVFDSRAPLLDARPAAASPRCEACR